MTEYMNPFTIFLLSVFGAGIGAYFGSYLREKGKNVATHEDIDKIVEELRKTTKAAEDIKLKSRAGYGSVRPAGNLSASFT